MPEIEPVIRDVKVLFPVKLLLLARSVDDAAVMVISAEPLNDTPLMRRGVARTVAELALPVRFPVAEVKNKFVVDAVVAKKLVVVALVPVPVVKVNDWSVVEPVWRAVAKVDAPETVRDPSVPIEVRDESVVTDGSM